MRDLTKSLGGRRMNELGKLIPAYLQAASGIRWFYIYAVPAFTIKKEFGIIVNKNCVMSHVCNGKKNKRKNKQKKK